MPTMSCFMCVVKCSEVEFHVSTLMPLKSPFKSLLKIFTVHVTFVKRPKLNCQKKPYLGENLGTIIQVITKNDGKAAAFPLKRYDTVGRPICRKPQMKVCDRCCS